MGNFISYKRGGFCGYAEVIQVLDNGYVQARILSGGLSDAEAVVCGELCPIGDECVLPVECTVSELDANELRHCNSLTSEGSILGNRSLQRQLVEGILLDYICGRYAFKDVKLTDENILFTAKSLRRMVELDMQVLKEG